MLKKEVYTTNKDEIFVTGTKVTNEVIYKDLDGSFSYIHSIIIQWYELKFYFISSQSF